MADDHGAVINHVGLCVNDLDRSREFYVQLFGFTVDRELTVPDHGSSYLLSVEAPVGLTAVYLERGAFTLELLHFDRPGNPLADERPFNQPGLTHLSFSVPDVAATCDRVAALGGEVLADTDVGGHAILVRDPDGQLLELMPLATR